MTTKSITCTNIRKRSTFQQRTWEWRCPNCQKVRTLKTRDDRKSPTYTRLCIRCSNFQKANAKRVMPYRLRLDGSREFNCVTCGMLVVWNSRKPDRRHPLNCRKCSSAKLRILVQERIAQHKLWHFDDPIWLRKRLEAAAVKYDYDIDLERPCIICGNMIQFTPNKTKHVLCSEGCRHEWRSRHAQKNKGNPRLRIAASLSHGGSADWTAACVICGNLYQSDVSIGTKTKDRSKTCSKRCSSLLRSQAVKKWRAIKKETGSYTPVGNLSRDDYA